ncbi:uncharacterized protein LOC115242557 [Formica exsecta]|uniref:uncharacterized protein LOC115242557 n=1 Tax=Formica exsecta TaxID=72781 RepID=UPI0011434587|nr:uncharacterized protein LOC115242557 [Formica exsecta]
MQQEMEMYYNYNNMTYCITATSDIHDKLQNDPEFFNKYFATNITSSEVVGVMEKENNDPIIESFSWTRQSTKLLLEKYHERKTKFRDPKIKKSSYGQKLLMNSKKIIILLTKTLWTARCET